MKSFVLAVLALVGLALPAFATDFVQVQRVRVSPFVAVQRVRVAPLVSVQRVVVSPFAVQRVVVAQPFVQRVRVAPVVVQQIGGGCASCDGVQQFRLIR